VPGVSRATGAALDAVAGRAHTGPLPSYGQRTIGGYSLADHAADPAVAAFIRNETPPWDIIVLQDHSRVPGGADPRQRNASRTALAEVLVPMVPPSSRIILFGTWAHLRGSVEPSQRAAYPDFPTMQRKTTAGLTGYLTHVRTTNQKALELAPVGDAFQLVYDAEIAAGREPTDGQGVNASLFARLFHPDGFHPSRLGTYLAACVFTQTLLAREISPRVVQAVLDLQAARISLDTQLNHRFDDHWQREVFNTKEAERLQAAAREAIEAYRRSAAIEHDLEHENYWYSA